MSARLGLPSVLPLVLMAACGTAEPISSGPPTTVPATTPNTSTAPQVTSTTTIDTTTLSTLPTTTALRVDTGPTLADGRPATFLAVTTDYEAVEVATDTGRIVRVIGQAASRQELEDAECAACANAIDGVWRTTGGASVFVSTCCEPAGGSITMLVGDETFGPETGPNLGGWFIVPSPSTDWVINVGYQTYVADSTGRPVLTLFDNDGGGVPAIGWSNDSRTIFWVDIPWFNADDPGNATHTALDLVTSEATTFQLTWLKRGTLLQGLSGQASGNLVSFLVDDDHSTTGVVIDPAGALVTTFPVEDGAVLGGYDPSGRFLIYVDGNGVVRWLGLGQSGALGEGFLTAGW
jgi:hypothetical protein